MSAQKENKELCNLININKDAYTFYNSAQKKVKNPNLKNTFLQLEAIHRNVASHVRNQVISNGGNPEASETMFGQVNQFWGNLMASISSDVDETFIKSLEQAEDRCLTAIRDILSSDEVSPETKEALRKELRTLENTHGYMKSLKEYVEAA